MSFSAMIDRLDDWINPIVVKELRQAVKSRLVTVVLLLFLGVQLLIVALFLTFQELKTGGDLLNSRAGNELFMVLQAILLGTCMVLIPAYTSVRMSIERSDTNVDLLFISTLRPSSIIGGKFFSALVLAMLVFSCCAPFLTFTYLLRGIDIPSILLVLGMDVLAIVLSTQVGLFLASIPASRAFKVFVFIGAFLLLCWIYAGLVAATSEMLREGVSRVPPSEFWIVMGVLAAIVLAVFFATGLLFCWSVALISPPAANRALMGRLFLVGAWLILGAVSLGLTLYDWGMGGLRSPLTMGSRGNHAPLMVWMICSVSLFCIQFLISINERDSWGSRVARTIPRWRIPRCCAFLFYSGSAGGVLLSVICVVLTLLLGWCWRGLFPHFELAHEIEPVLWVLTALGLYVFCFGMSGVLLRAYLLRDRIRAVYNWVLSFLLLGVGSSVPWMTALIVNSDRFVRTQELAWWMLTNPFWALYEIGAWSNRGGSQFTVACFLFLTIWALALTVLSVDWVGKQIARFHPPAPRVSSKESVVAESMAERVLATPAEAG